MPGLPATALQAANARRLPAPTTKLSNVYRLFRTMVLLCAVCPGSGAASAGGSRTSTVMVVGHPLMVSMISRHAEFTGSAKAKALLADWTNSVKKFVKVMPVDYKRALREMALEATEGGKA